MIPNSELPQLLLLVLKLQGYTLKGAVSCIMEFQRLEYAKFRFNIALIKTQLFLHIGFSLAVCHDSMVLTLASHFISPHDPVRQRSNAWGKSSCINACNLQHQSLLWNATQLSPAKKGVSMYKNGLQSRQNCKTSYIWLTLDL